MMTNRPHGANRAVWMLAAIMIAAVCAPAFALDNDEHRGEFGLQLGARWAESDLVGPSNNEDLRPVFGLAGAWAFSEHLAWIIDGNYSSHSTSLFSEADILTARTGLEARFKRNDKGAQWFIDVAPGWMDIDTGNAMTDFDRAMMSMSVGRRVLRDTGALRYELRADSSLGDDGLAGERVTNLAVMFGWSWGWGGFSDTDGDGVRDGSDKCPDTPKGAKVDEKGCPTDADGDGVWDGIDKCADTPKGWPVDATGCPKDSDGDSVPDGKDKCPNTPKGATVDATGCPKDSDGDGVWDGIDKCPDTPKGAKVDKTGCTMDTDGDGVPDGIDKCPNTPKGAKVDKTGCPMDTDGDGVWDGIDKCPGTPKGTPVDATGCAKQLFEGEERTLILEGVNFEFNSATLTANATTILDRVAASLAAWPEVSVEVGGHTDSVGSDSYNQKLSQRRADSVKAYLVSKQIDASRMTTRGYGESEPIADNGSEAGRAMNRRVELTRTD